MLLQLPDHNKQRVSCSTESLHNQLQRHCKIGVLAGLNFIHNSISGFLSCDSVLELAAMLFVRL